MSRTRDPNSHVGQIRSALLVLLEAHRIAQMLPTSCRFLFYELVMKGIVAKSRTNSRGEPARADQIVVNALMQLREDELTPWDWIVDETRELEDWTGYDSVPEGVLAQLPFIKLDPWVHDFPFVLCESRSLAGVLRALCQDLRTKIAPTNGQVGGFLRTDIGPALKAQYEFTGCVPRIGYLGDLDKAGGDIQGNTRRVLEKIVGIELDWTLLALTEAQVNLYHLPVIQKLDKRTKPPKMYDSVETEALSQAVIVQIVRDWLEGLLPDPLADVQAREESQRKFLESAIRWALNSPMGKKMFG
jgi:hypothetical protein